LLHSVITYVITAVKMLKVKITQVGNSMGILLPKEALAKMKTGKGDTLYLVEGPDGYTLTPYSQDFEEQMTAAEAALKNYRNTFRKLAQ
jgi:putative addiction module antidote